MLAFVKRMTFRNLIASALGLVGLGVVAIGLTVWALRSDVLREADVEISNIATILAEQTARSVRWVDLIATDIQERFSRDGQIDHALHNKDMRSEATWNFLVERQARRQGLLLQLRADSPSDREEAHVVGAGAEPHRHAGDHA